MSRALEFSRIPQAAGPTWFARLRGALMGRRGEGLVHLANPSPHLLRDIGITEDRRSNRLLQDHYLKR